MRRNGVSDEFLEDREADMAILITAADHIDNLRELAEYLLKRQLIDQSYYRDMRDSLDAVAWANHIGRRNTAARRREAGVCES